MKRKKQSNNNPKNYTPQGNECTDSPPSLNCDVYYLFTILYLIFLPQILLIMPVIINVSGIHLVRRISAYYRTICGFTC